MASRDLTLRNLNLNVVVFRVSAILLVLSIEVGVRCSFLVLLNSTRVLVRAGIVVGQHLNGSDVLVQLTCLLSFLVKCYFLPHNVAAY